MALILAENSTKSFEQPPEGTFPAICHRIVDIGTQTSTFDGETRHVHQVIVTWQLAGEERQANNEPFTISKWYTASFHPKSRLRIDLEAIRGRKFTPEELAGFDLQKVVGSSCMMGIVHDHKADGSVKAKISSLMKMPKGMAIGELELPKVFFDLGRFDQNIFEDLPPWIQNKIADSPEWQSLGAAPKAKSANGGIEDMDDDLPDF